MKAKAGQRTPFKDPTNSNLQMVWWFANRFSGLKYNVGYLKGIKGIVDDQSDCLKLNTVRSVSMDFDLKRMPIEESVKDGDLEFVDTLDTMELIWRGHKDKTKTDKYFTANFKDVLEFSKEDVKKNTIKLSYPTFQTKPIKDLDEFESIRAYWAEYRKKCEISEVLIDDDGSRFTWM